MATQRIFARIEQLIESEAEWLIADPILLKGEIAVVKFGNTTKIKIGDGIRKFSETPYMIFETGETKDGINPSTPSVTPTAPVSFIAETGVYPNFGGVEITGAAGYIVWNGLEWKAVNVTIDLTSYKPISSPYIFSENPIDSKALFEEIGGGNLIKGDFSRGFVLGGEGSGDFQATGGNLTLVEDCMRATSGNAVQGIIAWVPFSKGIYVTEVLAKVIALGDGKLGNGLNGKNQFVDLIDDGEFHKYRYENIIDESNNLIIWNQEFSSNTIQVLDIREIKIFDSTQGLLGKINQLAQKEDAVDYSLPADINHIIDYGQSLSLGATATAITTTVVSPNILMFRDNPRLAEGPLVPFAHHPTHSEVPIGGCATVIAELAKARGKSLENSQFLVSYAGEGGASINALSKGTEPYNRLIHHVSYGMEQAAALGKSYCLYAIQWTQGETDFNMDKAEYRAKLIQLRNNIMEDAKARTNQVWETPFVMYQPSSFNSKQVNPADYNKEFVTVYEEMGKQDLGFYFGNPNYDKVYTIENGGAMIIHLNAVSYKRMGGEYGVILDKLMTNRPYVKLAVDSVSFQGRLINIKFNKNLRIDTVNVNAIANFGFNVSGNTISSATVKDNRITLLCAADVDSTQIVTYAFNATDNAGNVAGPRGNIRSVDEYKLSFDTIYDWLGHSKLSLKSDSEVWCFYGSSATAPATQSEVKALPERTALVYGEMNIILDTGVINKVFVIVVPTGKTIKNAYDSTSEEDIKTNFIQSTMIVDDLSYRVFVMQNALPYSTNHVFQIDIDND
ncbi:hypothetical protein OQZ33_04450 [Pedobacter sp. MC2016-05]|uniref:sialate O-acetylesterase n=1 Tax=Pedobacter sp. MC2016-05 TaxID=2994474 RepID=UPI00224724C5|nr:sialate O-acetylesterase [Pedobacter sp. MC2016-05]MCX2473577.1 hypothetical protein [Pedobacter sp. MC2016-05]